MIIQYRNMKIWMNWWKRVRLINISFNILLFNFTFDENIQRKNHSEREETQILNQFHTWRGWNLKVERLLDKILEKATFNVFSSSADQLINCFKFPPDLFHAMKDFPSNLLKHESSYTFSVLWKLPRTLKFWRQIFDIQCEFHSCYLVDDEFFT